MKKKIYVCPKCGCALNFSDNNEYTFKCIQCDEEFHSFEAKEVEQPRMEGVKDYTELVEAAMKIKAITDKAIQESTKQIEIKSKDIVEQISEYIYETIKPVLDSGIYNEYKFRDCARIYSSNFRLDFGKYLTENGECQAQLFGINGNVRVYFKRDDGYYVENAGWVTYLVKEWQTLKDSMHRMIAYAIEENNKENQKQIKMQEEKHMILNNFKL